MCTEVDPTMQDDKETNGNERILRDVIEENLGEKSQSKVSPSFQYVTNMESTPLKGGRSRQDYIPIFMPDATELLEYTKATDLRKTYNDM